VRVGPFTPWVHMGALWRAASAKVEKKHIIGQGTCSKGRRNRALKPAAVMSRTMLKTTPNSWQRSRARIMSSDMLKVVPLRSSTTSTQSFASRKANARAAAVGVAARRTLVTTTTNTLKAKPAYNEFRKQDWNASAKVGGAALPREQLRVTQLWKELSEEQIAHYRTLADNRNAMIDAEGVDAVTVDGDSSAAGRATSYGHRAARRRVSYSIVETYVNHPAWSSGLNLAGPNGPLRTALIDVATTQLNTKAQARQFCRLRPRVRPEPAWHP
jgi:hypothetical protein